MRMKTRAFLLLLRQLAASASASASLSAQDRYVDASSACLRTHKAQGSVGSCTYPALLGPPQSEAEPRQSQESGSSRAGHHHKVSITDDDQLFTALANPIEPRLIARAPSVPPRGGAPSDGWEAGGSWPGFSHYLMVVRRNVLLVSAAFRHWPSLQQMS
jgi:hypothetical protein